ncbi:stage II sporulation protein M [Candidatus Woesearchaeota archaeon]|nr:stage II sporulation protein M [Candidatus Woesearchaeota archaeon]
MVLESLITPKAAEKAPQKMFLFGILYAVVAIILTLWVFERQFQKQASLIPIFLIAFASIPLIYKTIVMEEKKDEKIKKEMILLKEHARVLSFFLFLFIGILVTLTASYIILPETTVNNLFDSQMGMIQKINGRVVGGALSETHLLFILSNNLKVLIFAFIFSFFYGSGAIFILTWNASIIATASGALIRTKLGEYAATTGFGHIANYLGVFSLGIMKYMTHGVFEILAYFVGGLAGGIISVAVIRHRIEEKRFKKVVSDSLDLSIIAVLLLIIGALVEVYITPIFF